MRTLKFILLPLLGVLAALMAFKLAGPFEGTLTRPNLGSEDPRALFTYGTRWGEINRLAFGAFLCGPFAIVLTLGRQSWLRVVLAGVIGTVLGGIINFVTDSAADVLGLAISTKSPGFGSLIAMLAWCVFVPFGIAITLVLSQGISSQRIRRALFAIRITAVASFAVQMVGGMLAVQDGNGEINLQSQIPVWRMVEIAVGLAFGCTILLADERIRVGTVRLVFGRNEYRDWSLDHVTNRIGSAEGSEIYVRGFQGVDPLHAVIIRQGNQFVLEAKSPTTLNGQPVSRASLNSHDEITIGNARLIFLSNGAVIWTPAPTQIQLTPQSQVTTQFAPAPYNPPQPLQTQYASTRILQDTFGNQIPLVPGRYGVGREQTNAICLFHDPNVSPVHAEIMATATDLIVNDLRSATGTRVNGVPITAPTNLRRGDVVEFGAVRFSYIQ